MHYMFTIHVFRNSQKRYRVKIVWLFTNTPSFHDAIQPRFMMGTRDVYQSQIYMAACSA